MKTITSKGNWHIHHLQKFPSANLVILNTKNLITLGNSGK